MSPGKFSPNRVVLQCTHNKLLGVRFPKFEPTAATAVLKETTSCTPQVITLLAAVVTETPQKTELKIVIVSMSQDTNKRLSEIRKIMGGMKGIQQRQKG